MNRAFPQILAALFAWMAIGVDVPAQQLADDEIVRLLVGTWIREVETKDGGVAKQTQIFEANGNYSGNLVTSIGGKKVTLREKGTWEVKNGKLDMHPVPVSPSGKADGKKANDDPPVKIVKLSTKEFEYERHNGKRVALRRQP